MKTKNDVGRLLLADCFARTVLIEALTHAGGLPTLENSQKEKGRGFARGRQVVHNSDHRKLIQKSWKGVLGEQ